MRFRNQFRNFNFDNMFCEMQDEFKMLRNRFRSPTLNQKPLYVYREEDDGKLILSIDAIGFGKEDLKDGTLKVDYDQDTKILSVSGSKKIESIDYEISVDRQFRFPVGDIEKILVSIENGIVYISFIQKEKPKKQNIVHIED